MTIRTRFAPSPTGFLHIGGVRTALFNWLLAKRHGGTFVLRIEDTDAERSTKESIDNILEGMSWLGLNAGEGPFFQMSRLGGYQVLVQQLMDSGDAYRCYCSRDELASMRKEQKSKGLKPRYDGRCRSRTEPVTGIDPVVRFKTPTSGKVCVRDHVHGEIVFDNAELDDLIILRSDGVPTYNFSVVVDDSEMGITHVVRGDDHLNNTPRQLNIMKALGIEPPEYAHLPMILGPDGSRLSKRHGALNVLSYKETGYLPEAVLNYIVRLGWSYGDQELFDIDEMINLFDLGCVNESAASFDPDKFLWVNEQWLKRVSVQQLGSALIPMLEAEGIDPNDGPSLPELAEVQRDRVQTLSEMVSKSLFIYNEPEEYAPKAAKQHLTPMALITLQSLQEELTNLDDWGVDSTQIAVETVAEKLDLKMGKVAQPLRVAVTGDSASPGIGQTLALLGREKTLQRLETAIEYIKRLSDL